MKVTVSIPDDLWTQASPDDAKGPSDTVQRALRALADQQRAALRPMAHAPDRSNLERYTPKFEDAVQHATESIGRVLDHGYRFGLLIAPGLTTSDFDAIDRREARREIQEIAANWGSLDAAEEFSYDFAGYVESVLNSLTSDDDEDSEPRSLVQELLGDDPANGVRWLRRNGEEGEIPKLSDTYVDGVLAALRDVRDEALRRMQANRTEGDLPLERGASLEGSSVPTGEE